MWQARALSSMTFTIETLVQTLELLGCLIGFTERFGRMRPRRSKRARTRGTQRVVEERKGGGREESDGRFPARSGARRRLCSVLLFFGLHDL